MNKEVSRKNSGKYFLTVLGLILEQYYIKIALIIVINIFLYNNRPLKVILWTLS